MRHSEKIIWSPQPRQREFMQRGEFEALYGGAAGGGKSDALLAEALRQVSVPHYRGLILRKTYPQLSQLVDRSAELYPKAVSGAVFNQTRHLWQFPSGAKIYFGSMQHAEDRVNYQGKRFDYIAFDELTQFSWEEYSYMFSRCRPGGEGTRCYIRASANPGGRGHGWVKERFITPAPPMTPVYDEISLMLPDGGIEAKRQGRVFVPSTVFDNRILMKSDPLYAYRLAMLPEAERKALLYGDWDSFWGQVFLEWRNDPSRYLSRRGTHVISPFIVPQSWSIYRGFDFGYTRPFSVGWYAIDHDRRAYRIRELYGCTGTPNEGVRWEPLRIAEEIKKIERDDPNLKGKRVRGIADPSIFDESRGESVGAMMERAGIYFDRGDNSRIAGKMQMHHRLAFDDEGMPMLYVFSTCRNFIRTIPALVYDSVNVEDIDTDGEDHIYDECRYVLMEYPVSPPVRQKAEQWCEGPLDYGRYDTFSSGVYL
ncbi:MAG: phage terminase large subunit [Clostridiaceae bacterium]|nr:phage terminase large subunit [Clostridiaceae bacterium]